MGGKRQAHPNRYSLGVGGKRQEAETQGKLTFLAMGWARAGPDFRGFSTIFDDFRRDFSMDFRGFSRILDVNIVNSVAIQGTQAGIILQCVELGVFSVLCVEQGVLASRLTISLLYDLSLSHWILEDSQGIH